jgi:hypothetical protein
MKSALIAAAALTVGFLLAVALLGRYEIIPTANSSYGTAYRLDKLGGQVHMILMDKASLVELSEPSEKETQKP